MEIVGNIKGDNMKLSLVYVLNMIQIICVAVIATIVIAPIDFYTKTVIVLIVAQSIVFCGIQEIKSKTKIKAQNNLLKQLECRGKILEENYDEVRSFKHDFCNIMQSLGGYIYAEDLEGLKRMYEKVFDECKKVNKKQFINSTVINNPALYNLICYKYLQAEEKGVKLNIGVFTDLTKLNINDYYLCRILGILIDNAIEAAKDCSEKNVNIRFEKLHQKKGNMVVIENNYNRKEIDLDNIYNKGVSSKNDLKNHGLGLWKVKDIINKNNKINIFTSAGKMFVQQLEII